MDSTMKLPEYILIGSYCSDENVNFHDHQGTELVYVTSGKCEITVGNMLFSGQAGTLFVLPDSMPHNQIAIDTVGTLYVIFRNCVCFDDHPRTLDLTQDIWIKRWLDDIFALRQEPHNHLNMLGAGLIFLILRRIAELETTMRQRTAFHPALLRAVTFIEQNFTNAITLNDIAKQAGVCPEYLCCLFKQQLNQTPVSYLLELRLKYAGRLLDDRYLSVKEISGLCGFNDVNYFCRRFKQYHGHTPGKLRE